MKEIALTFKMNVHDEGQRAALHQIIDILAEKGVSIGSIVEGPAAKKVKATPVKPAKTKPAQAPEAKAEKSDLTLEQVQGMVRACVKEGHKEEVMTKLGELGAKSVSTLDESKYREFFDWCTSEFDDLPF